MTQFSIQIGRMNGKHAADQMTVAFAHAFQAHIHFLTRTGSFCVGATKICPECKGGYEDLRDYWRGNGRQ